MGYAIDSVKLCKKFGEIIAVDNVNMQIEAGKIVGLVGPNGAGKTTFLKLLTGSIKPTKGTARINGWDVQDEGVRARTSLGYIPEETKAYPLNMRGDTFVRYLAELKGLTRAVAKKESCRMLKIVGMEHLAKRKIVEMSSGMKQRIGLAQALVCNPTIIIADEPLAFLDPVGKQEMITLFLQLVDDEQITLLISSHVLGEIEALVKDVHIINRGKIVSSGSLKVLLRSVSNVFIINVNKPEAIRNRLLDLPSISNVDTHSDGLLITSSVPEILFKELPRILFEEKANLITFHPLHDSLEKFFLDVIAQKGRME